MTIKKWARIGSGRLYTLVYPNLEVKKGLTENLLRYLTGSSAEQIRNRVRLYRCLEAEDLNHLRDIFHAFFASIPYDWYRKNESAQYEGYYASIFYCYFTALGLDVTAEQMTNKGRIDMAVRLGGRVFILEFKVVEMDGDGQKALDQIRRMRYWERYRGHADAIFLIGVAFSSVERNIVGFEWERIHDA